MNKKIIFALSVIVILVLILILIVIQKTTVIEFKDVPDEIKKESVKDADLSLTLSKDEIESVGFVVEKMTLENPMKTGRPSHMMHSEEEYEYILLAIVLVEGREELDYFIESYKRKNYADYIYSNYVESYEAKNSCDIGEKCNYKFVGDESPNILLWFIKEDYIVSVRIYHSQEGDIDKLIAIGNLISDKINEEELS